MERILMRNRVAALFTVLVLLTAPFALMGSTVIQTTIPRASLGTQIITPVAATKLTVPSGAIHCMICIWTNPVHMGDPIASATVTTSYPRIPSGTCMTIENDPAWMARIQFIDTSAGASSVEVWYWTNGTTGYTP